MNVSKKSTIYYLCLKKNMMVDWKKYEMWNRVKYLIKKGFDVEVAN